MLIGGVLLVIGGVSRKVWKMRHEGIDERRARIEAKKDATFWEHFSVVAATFQITSTIGLQSEAQWGARAVPEVRCSERTV